MNPNVWLPVLTAALVLVSAYYAWTVHKLLRTTEEMVSATKEMVETSLKTYILSVVPQVVCRTVTRTATDPQPAGELIISCDVIVFLSSMVKTVKYSQWPKCSST